MKKLIASVIVAAAIALPAVPAAAGGADAWWGRKPCDWGEVGTVIWHDTPATEYEEIRLCFPRVGPGAPESGDVYLPVGVHRCGGTGIVVWYYDLQGRYHEPVNTCI
ncbi:MAG: hypothetical protein M3134_09265 [Actinomycetota bacterium]|nr:hypothetical protein [Actinomycetota bacterium]